MRGPFLRELAELADRDPRVVLLTGDLGFMAIEPFAERHPTRFFNVGVAEQNMVGMATGLAEAGFLPFVYSIVTFATLRAYEFIRNGPILHRLPVRVVGVGGGLEYGHNGPTHYGLEDVGVLRLQPGMTVLAPADRNQAVAGLRATWDAPGPVYYRLGKDDSAVVPGLEGRLSPSGIDWVRTGSDALIVAMGSIATEAERACALLARDGVDCGLLLASQLAPAPSDALAAAIRGRRNVFTVEAHYVDGGMGSMVAEVVADHGLGCRVTRCGVRSLVDGRSGSLAYLYGVHGLSAEALAATVKTVIGVGLTSDPASSP